MVSLLMLFPVAALQATGLRLMMLAFWTSAKVPLDVSAATASPPFCMGPLHSGLCRCTKTAQRFLATRLCAANANTSLIAAEGAEFSRILILSYNQTTSALKMCPQQQQQQTRIHRNGWYSPLNCFLLLMHRISPKEHFGKSHIPFSSVAPHSIISYCYCSFP
jgi:hypothetical protein